LLLGTRLVVWAWCSTGLAVRQAALVLIVCGTISGLWIAGALCYRFWEVPIAGPSIDVKEVEESIPKVEANEAGLRMRTAGQEFRERLEFASVRPQRVMPRVQPNQELTTLYAERLAEVIKGGWPEQDGELERWLDETFTRLPAPDRRESWARLYADAAAMPLLGVVDDPLTSSLYRELPSCRRALDAGTFLEARALQLQARQRDDEALDQVVLILALSRQLRNYALTKSYSYGRQLEAKGYDALDRWLTAPRSPELLRRALAKLDEHEQRIPPVSWSVKVEHARMYYLLARGELFQTATSSSTSEAEIVPVLEFAPWERSRHLRILNALTEAGFRVADLEPLRAAALLDSWEPTDDDNGAGRMALNRGLTLLDDGDVGSAAEQWGRLLSRNRVASLYRVETLDQRVQEGIAQARHRAAKLKIALLLYRQEHQGQPAPDLQTLVVQKILATVPLDPFDGRPFRYRLSDGRDVNWGMTHNSGPKPLAGGVLWSVGPDGIDNGGRNAGHWQGWSDARRWQAQQLDAVFLVPSWGKP
jgi:hypothetical protein